MTATLFCVDTYEHVDELIWCLEQNFPAPVTEALLRLLDDTDLLPQAFTSWKLWSSRPRYLFLEAVQEVTGDYCSLCDDCEVIVWDDDTTTISHGHRVCDVKCLDSYYWCDYCSSYAAEASYINDETVCDSCCSEHFTCCIRCDTYCHDDDVTNAGEDAYCDRCRDRYLTYCEECEEWYTDGDHNHCCDCEAPHQRFTFPANGDGAVEQDERLQVSLPTGTIDDEGIERIRQLLVNSTGQYGSVIETVLDDVGPLWQAKRGNFTRRLSSAFYSQHRIKLDSTVVSEIGNLARAHSSDEATWHVEFTRDLNQDAAAFAHSSSCWWGGFVPSRCALKSWGGLAMRTYPDRFQHRGSPSGRMWIQPLDEDLCPTHDALNAHAYVLYNGYGVLSGYTAPRIVAHLAGRTYRKIEVTSNVDNSYINGDTGYLVADEATCASTDSVSFNYDEHDNFDAHNLMRVAA